VLIELRTAESSEDCALLADLARDIWTEHYAGIVDLEQIEYMLNTIQTPAAISKQIEHGYHYSVVLVDMEPAGYLSYHVDTESRELFLNKFYVAEVYRGMGVGKYMLNIVEQVAVREACRKIWLVVNINNVDTIAAYEKMGFINKGALKTDIGNGYIMDDYRLVKVVGYSSMMNMMG
jgi:ribosomal protein S18 acetylase RimI-like enzyme